MAKTLADLGYQVLTGDEAVDKLVKRGVDIVVGTPGRLLDLIQQHALDLSAVQTVILDEADEMLSMGFIEDIEAILAETPDTRQTALFSATLPQPIRRLATRGAEVAVLLATGQPVPDATGALDNGFKQVPSLLIEPIAVDRDNMAATVIADGFHKVEDVYRDMPKEQWPTVAP